MLDGVCAAAEGQLVEAADLLDAGGDAARAIGDTIVELFARAALVPIEIASGNTRRTEALVRRCRDDDRTPALLRTFGLAVAPVLAGEEHPREAAIALLDLADRPVVRMGGDAVRYRLVAAALLLRAADLDGVQRVAAEARTLCGGLGSPLVGPCDAVLARVRRATGDITEAARLAHRGLEQLTDDGVRAEVPDAVEVLGAEGPHTVAVAQRLDLASARSRWLAAAADPGGAPRPAGTASPRPSGR